VVARDNYSAKTAEAPEVRAREAAPVEEAALAAVPVVVAEAEECSEDADGSAARR
jgi:hypothetical protein